jgi:hypothetical protein
MVHGVVVQITTDADVSSRFSFDDSASDGATGNFTHTVSDV